MKLSLDARLLSPVGTYRLGFGLASDVVLGMGIATKTHRQDGFPAGQPHYAAVWCLRGRAVFDDGTRRVEILPGMIFQRFPGIAHVLEIEPGSGWTEAWIGLGASLIPGLVAHRLLDPERPVQAAPVDPVLLQAFRAETASLSQARNLEIPRHLTRVLGLLADLLSRAPAVVQDVEPRQMDEACRRLAEDPRLDLRRLAREQGMAYDRFRKRFRAEVGMAPRDYRILQRVAMARVLLLTSDLSIAAIADRLGYGNPFVLTAQFRQHMGQPPAYYRRAKRAARQSC